MTAFTSTCHESFGHDSFDRTAVTPEAGGRCPVRGCSARLLPAPYGNQGKTVPWCPQHGIKIHPKTFVYWNGSGADDEARLRNFIVGRDLARRIALPRGKKAESHRLGAEMSEDALSWNVLVSLAVAGRLRDAVRWLSGRSVSGQPQLYLWGRRIGFDGERDDRYPPLDRVGHMLEAGVRRFRTEPDVMLVVPGEMTLCIEAKFGSGNPLAVEAPAEPGDKPTSRSGLLARYLAPSPCAKIAFVERPSPRHFHSQLFRNIVFACEMAQGEAWHVANLVSSTQWAHAAQASARSARYSFADPTDSVRDCLRADYLECFTFRTWEALHADLVHDDPALCELDAYLRRKSAHFEPAFALERPGSHAESRTGGVP